MGSLEGSTRAIAMTIPDAKYSKELSRPVSYLFAYGRLSNKEDS
jgi:hypothetical protein